MKELELAITELAKAMVEQTRDSIAVDAETAASMLGVSSRQFLRLGVPKVKLGSSKQSLARYRISDIHDFLAKRQGAR